MKKQDQARPEVLEARLKTADLPEDERQGVFEGLSRLYAEDLQKKAIMWANARYARDPVHAGQEALARAFILLAEKLSELNFTEHTLWYYYQGRIWSEIGHLKTGHTKHEDRFRPLDDASEVLDESPDTGPEDRMSAREELQAYLKQVRTAAEQRLLKAGLFKMLGYTWPEVARKVGWEGPPESLRVSFARLKKQLRARLRGQIPHVHPEPR